MIFEVESSRQSPLMRKSFPWQDVTYVDKIFNSRMAPHNPPSHKSHLYPFWQFWNRVAFYLFCSCSQTCISLTYATGVVAFTAGHYLVEVNPWHPCPWGAWEHLGDELGTVRALPGLLVVHTSFVLAIVKGVGKKLSVLQTICVDKSKGACDPDRLPLPGSFSRYLICKQGHRITFGDRTWVYPACCCPRFNELQIFAALTTWKDTGIETLA